MTVSIPYTLLYTFFTLIGYLTFSRELVLPQLALFYLMVRIGCIWTLVTPVYFSRALGRAKERVVARYRGHLEESFKSLLEDPSPEHLERYHWLKAQQSEVLDITTAALGVSVRTGVVAVNAYILVTAFLYPFAKFRVSPQDAVDWFSATFMR
jgi:hypothetical protein